MFLLSPAPVVFSNISTVFLSKEILPMFTLQFRNGFFMRYLCRMRTNMFYIFSYIQLLNYTVLYIRCQFGAQVVCLLFTEGSFEFYAYHILFSLAPVVFSNMSTDNFVEKNITHVYITLLILDFICVTFAEWGFRCFYLLHILVTELHDSLSNTLFCRIQLNWVTGKPSGDIACMGKQQHRGY